MVTEDILDLYLLTVHSAFKVLRSHSFAFLFINCILSIDFIYYLFIYLCVCDEILGIETLNLLRYQFYRKRQRRALRVACLTIETTTLFHFGH